MNMFYGNLSLPVDRYDTYDVNNSTSKILMYIQKTAPNKTNDMAH